MCNVNNVFFCLFYLQVEPVSICVSSIKLSITHPCHSFSAVKLYTDKLKVAFAVYEEAHESVIESLKDDQAACDRQGELFVQMEEHFVESLGSARSCIGEETTSTTNAVAQLLNMPKVEIKSFDGTPTSYLSFMAVFDEIVGNVNIGGQAKLTRLLQYTTDTARDAIDCCALIGGDQGYNEARRILGGRFGDPYIITTRPNRQAEAAFGGPYSISAPHFG